MSLILDKLAQALDPQQPEALLIGGQALPAYGLVRQTLDIDCLAAEAGSAKLHAVLVDEGYQMVARSAAFVRYHHADETALDVDILLVDHDVYEKMFRDSLAWRVAGANWRVPSLPHLVALKLHAIKNNRSRQGRDLNDIGDLLRLNPGTVTREIMGELCLKYGPPGIFGVLERLGIWNS
jgi:hypothetical protein